MVPRPAAISGLPTDYRRASEIATEAISLPGAWIEIDWRLALVLMASSADSVPDTRTWMWLPRATPSMLPPTWRVVSAQLPEQVPEQVRGERAPAKHPCAG
jgi:hypothetical protein